MPKTLRWYQEKALKALFELIRQGKKRIVLYLPTGGGKTLCATYLGKSARRQGKKMGFGVNRVQLCNQAVKAFVNEDQEVGVLQGQNTSKIDANTIIFSIDTVRSRGLPEDIQLLVLDEAHGTVNTKAYHGIMKDRICIGLTATPFAKGMAYDVPALEGPLWEAIVVGATISELIEWNKEHPNEGLVPCEVWIPHIVDVKNMRESSTNGEKDYNIDDQAKALNTPRLIEGTVEKWLQICPNTLTMLFATTIKHSQELCQAFREAGVKAEHVDYHMDPSPGGEREQIYDRFRSGEITVVCNCILLGVGADFPACETIILNRIFKSKVLLTQIIGRAMRPTPDGKKKMCRVLDFGGSMDHDRLGCPWHYSVGHLDDGKPKRKAIKKGMDVCEECFMDKPKKINKCPHCGYEKPKKIFVCSQCKLQKKPGQLECPNCGHRTMARSEIEYVSGELRRLNSKEKSETIPASSVLQAKGKQRIYSELTAHAIEMGYSDGWIGHQYRALFGVWPKGLERIPIPTGPELKSYLHRARMEYTKTKGRKK